MKERLSPVAITQTSDSKRKRGRPRIENYKDVNQIIKAYKVHKNLAAASRALNVDVKTLKRVLMENDIAIHKPSLVEIQKYGALSRREGKFARWLKEHPKSELPPNMKKIAKVTGCTYDQVKSYLRYRKSRIKDVLKTLPDIKHLDVVLEDTLGYYIKSDEIKDYKFRINKYTCDITMLITLFDGTVTEAHIDNIKSFQDEVKKVLK